MNILIPHSWLLEHLETSAEPTDIQKYVSLCGPSVERIYEREGEAVYDIEVTTNRVDSMSVRGIAREAAVILNQFGIKATLKPLQLPTLSNPTDQTLPLPKIVDDHQLAKRIMCVMLSNVQRTPTPETMAKRLRQIDQQVHDSVIDITNYVTHELGHSCHAFDYDAIMKLGGVINIVEAKAGKKFTTLDGVEYTTVGGEIVFENPAGEIIDLPAIKGTLNSSISDSTTNVMLWIESLEAKKVRFASMTHAIRTVAAQLNEKNADPELAEPVLLAGAEWYQKLCGAQIASQVTDIYPAKTQLATITVSLKQIETYLGLALPLEKITTILTDLGCQVSGMQTLTVTPPSFRPDLAIPADIVEEIARIYGYHNLPSTLMTTAIPTEKPADLDLVLESRIKHFLADMGWQEIYGYSMVSQEIALQSGLKLENHLKIQNYLTDDRIYLRRSLLPSLVEVLYENKDKKELSVFEVANTYVPQSNQLPNHVLQLGLVSRQDYRTVRGVIENLLRQFYLKEIEVVPATQSNEMWAQLAEIKVVDQSTSVTLGQIGMLTTGMVGAVIEVAALMKVAKKHPTYQPIPKTSSIIEDLTFTLPEGTLVGPVINTLQSQSPLITQVELKDIFQQNHTFTLTYHDRAQSLSDADIAPLRKQVVAAVEENHQAKLVGSLT
jgi:phenylalanyl-tRNA synthetase beta chain